MIRELIEKQFRSTIEDKFKTNLAVKSFLLNHERKDLFIENMCKHLKPVDLGLTAVTLTRDKIEGIVKDMTLFFCKVAIDHVEKVEIEKIKAAAEHAKEMEEFKVELDERAEFVKKVF